MRIVPSAGLEGLFAQPASAVSGSRARRRIRILREFMGCIS
jgi:hypothetical protein